MSRKLHGPDEWVSATFAAILLSSGAIQFGVELGRGQVPQALELFTRSPTAAHLRTYEDRLEEENWLASQVRPWMQYAQFLSLDDPGPKVLLGRRGWWFYQPGVGYATQPTSGASASGDPVVAICDYRAQLAKRGIHLVVVVVPNKASIYPEVLTRRAERLPGAVSASTRSVLERLRAAGVEVVDLFEVYHQAKSASATGPGEDLYLVQDSHWSPAGLELAAQAVARRLLDRHWIQPGQTSYERRSVRLQRLGDLVTVLQIPPLQRRWSPEPVACTQIVQSDAGEVYRDDPEAGILVLGDSFLRIFQQDEPSGAGFLAHLAYRLSQPVSSLVNDGGASTLVRQDLHRRPALLANKKVVVWEFVERDILFGTEGWSIVPLPGGQDP